MMLSPWTAEPNRTPGPMDKVVGILLGGTIIALALATLLSLLARHGWLLDLLTFARQHLVVIGLVLAGAALRTKRRRWALAAGALAACNLVLVLAQAGPGALTSRASASGVELRVLTLNLLAENYYTKRVVRYLRASGADIVALQELTPYWAEKLAELQDIYPYVSPPLQPWKSSSVILSRHPFVEAGAMRAPADTVTGKWNRPLRAVVDVGSERIAVYVVHPETPRSLQQWQMRNRYFAWLGEEVRRLDGERPRIVLGDFNTPPWSPFLQDFAAAAEVHQAAAGLRWPTRQPLILAPYLSWLGAPVDHILLSPGLEAAAFTVGSDVKSDHLPVIADVWLPAHHDGPSPHPSAARPAR
ncbi:endonuclease/exonuclease/phosphatase family protein [Benzoatithermus flavus]|uniref:Endonuclease/exonuclease/phosphatase family protein n=1 Tax=Benzoatithermus flavus TaxID=3108223 RepID=A0ABU8XKF4_9PROT